MPAMPYLILVAGPTAVGKTALAIEIALTFGTEIISADSRQIFRELKLGVARPTEQQLTQVKHHFIGTVSIHDRYNAGLYAREAGELLSNLFRDHDQVVVCGGSGLYIKALIEGLDEFPPVPEQTRAKWNQVLQTQGLAYLQQCVQAQDPDYFKRVDQYNPQRLLRALEVMEVSGKPYSGFLHNSANPRINPYSVIPIILDLPREELYARINDRVLEMIQNGLVEEVTGLWSMRHISTLNTVGYKEIFAYLAGTISLAGAIAEIQQHTRNYAKRQITWFNKYLTGPRFHPNEKRKIFEYLKSHLHD